MAAAIVAIPPAAAAPYVPTDDKLVLERLPARLADASAREIRELRRRVAEKPGDADAAGALAQAYYELARRRGDPRYVGYAQAVLAPWPAPTDAPVPILLARALIAQFLHDFAGAERDLTRIIDREPNHLGAWSYRAILRLVQARYDEARSDCHALSSRAAGLAVGACEPTVRALAGEAAAAYQNLRDALASERTAPDNERLWVLTRLGEIADRLGRHDDADRHFRAALAIGIDDQYLLATYAEFLLDRGRPAEVLPLLRGHTQNDVLLLRLALAEHAVAAPTLAARVETLRARIEAARRRGDELHLADEAMFELRFAGAPAAAVVLARRNWDSGQREPGDARILLEAALAAGARAGAEPALAWLKASGHEDARLQALAARLQALPR